MALPSQRPAAPAARDAAPPAPACPLQGALIVKPADGKPERGLQGTWDEERLIFLQDWFHGQAEALAMSLNR